MSSLMHSHFGVEESFMSLERLVYGLHSIVGRFRSIVGSYFSPLSLLTGLLEMDWLFIWF